MMENFIFMKKNALLENTVRPKVFSNDLKSSFKIKGCLTFYIFCKFPGETYSRDSIIWGGRDHTLYQLTKIRRIQIRKSANKLIEKKYFFYILTYVLMKPSCIFFLSDSSRVLIVEKMLVFRFYSFFHFLGANSFHHGCLLNYYF